MVMKTNVAEGCCTAAHFTMFKPIKKKKSETPTHFELDIFVYNAKRINQSTLQWNVNISNASNALVLNEQRYIHKSTDELIKMKLSHKIPISCQNQIDIDFRHFIVRKCKIIPIKANTKFLNISQMHKHAETTLVYFFLLR